MARAIAIPALWLGGVGIGTLGTGLLFQAVTGGNGFDLLVGLMLFLPGLYVAGSVLAWARRAHTRARSHALPRPLRRA